MNPIELGKAIAEVGIPAITAVMLVLVVGLVWYLIKRQTKREDKHDKERIERQIQYDNEQKETRLYHRNLITNHLEHISEVSLKNAELNAQGIILQKKLVESFEKHDEHTDKVSGKMIKSLDLICDRLNGGSSKMKEAKKKLSEKGGTST